MNELETSSYKLVTHHFGCILHELWVSWTRILIAF